MATGLSAYVYLLHNDSGEPVGAINKRYPRYSRNTISRHATKDPNAAQKMKTSKSCGRLTKNIKQERGENNKNAKTCEKNT